MTIPMIRIHDLATDEIVDREMTAPEFAAYQAQQAAEAKAVDEATAAKKSAEAKLAALGLTAEDLKALGL
jgi:hypothetical protein